MCYFGPKYHSHVGPEFHLKPLYNTMHATTKPNLANVNSKRRITQQEGMFFKFYMRGDQKQVP